MFSTPMSNLGSNMIALAIGAAIVLCSQMYAKYKSEKAVEAAAAAAATTTAKE